MKNSITAASLYANPTNLALTAIVINIEALRTSLSTMNTRCGVLNAAVRLAICTGIPSASEIPDIGDKLQVSSTFYFASETVGHIYFWHCWVVHNAHNVALVIISLNIFDASTTYGVASLAFQHIQNGCRKCILIA